MAPRDWKAPGFKQTPAEPVVCVSWADAKAYAAWLGEKTGRHYRIPKADEAAQVAPAPSAHPVAQWIDACGSDCGQRVTGGRSWRGVSGNAARDADRGYDDVGFRLVRDL